MKQLAATGTGLLGLGQTADAMDEDFHASMRAAHLVASPGEIGHINSAMGMEEANCVPLKAVAPLPERVAYANSTEVAGDASEHCVRTWHRVVHVSATSTAEGNIAKYPVAQRTRTENGGAKDTATLSCRNQNLTQNQNLIQNQTLTTWKDSLLCHVLVKPQCHKAR